MKVLHLLARGSTGGIERLCEDFEEFSTHENTFVFVWGKDETTYLNMQRRGADVFQLNAENKNLLKVLREIDQLREQKQAQVVIVHHDAPLLYLYLIFLKITHRNIKTIIYAHSDAVFMCSPNKKNGLVVRKIILQLALKSVDCIVAISESVRKSLLEYLKADDRKICIVYNGVNIKRFQSKPHLISKPLKIIYVGRLIKEKGVQITLDALALLPSNLKWTFQIVGDGSYRQQLECIVKEKKLQQSVEFLGTQANVPEFLKQADVFIHMPVWKEGFGIAVVEAMASGLICICANNGAMSEIVSNGKNGYLIEKENAKELSVTLQNLMTVSPQEIEKLQANAIATAAKFSMDEFSNGLDKVIGQVVLSSKENRATNR